MTATDTCRPVVADSMGTSAVCDPGTSGAATPRSRISPDSPASRRRPNSGVGTAANPAASPRQRAAACFEFNGWGEKYVMPGDTHVAPWVAGAAGVPAWPQGFILEGGAVDRVLRQKLHGLPPGVVHPGPQRQQVVGGPFHDRGKLLLLGVGGVDLEASITAGELRARGGLIGAAHEESARKALDHLGEYALMLRVLGSYSRYR